MDAVRVTPVPLPAALPLLGAGLAVLGFVGWRRRQAA
ncbi:MAG: VPLPA-CTERM sorting domain-containing protein [Pseudomonadota bacterium]